MKLINPYFWQFRVALSTVLPAVINYYLQYRGADKSLAPHTSRCILFDGENTSVDASLVLYIYK